MISFIMPMYHKAAMLKATLPYNSVFEEKDVEVVCVLDEPSEEKEVLATVKDYPQVKWRVIVNDVDHAWRPPCIPHNVGLKRALGDHVVFFDAESILSIPFRRYLQDLIQYEYACMYSGLGWHVDDPFGGVGRHSILRRCARAEATQAPCFWGFGFLMAPKVDVMHICGYDESRTEYGLDDDDIRKRLTKFGVQCRIDPLIKVYHLWHDNPMQRTGKRTPTAAHVVLREQQNTWGMEYGRIAFDWRTTT